MFTRKLVRTLIKTLHGGVPLTMTPVHEEHWIPTLRQLFRSVRSACWGCKCFQDPALTIPPPGTSSPHHSRHQTTHYLLGQWGHFYQGREMALRSCEKTSAFKVSCGQLWNHLEIQPHPSSIVGRTVQAVNTVGVKSNIFRVQSTVWCPLRDRLLFIVGE